MEVANVVARAGPISLTNLDGAIDVVGTGAGQGGVSTTGTGLIADTGSIAVRAIGDNEMSFFAANCRPPVGMCRSLRIVS